MFQDFKKTEMNTVHKLKNEAVMYMYDECTMDIEIKVLIPQWILSNTYLKMCLW